MPSINTSTNNRYEHTENGTPIIPGGQDINKDMFLKILSAQISNQDPMNPQDGTAYVTQLAQFAQMEQSLNQTNAINELINVNNGVLVNSAMSSAISTIGKQVEVSDQDENKNNYAGKVESVHIKDGIVYLDLRVNETNELKSFSYGSLLKIVSQGEEISTS